MLLLYCLSFLFGPLGIDAQDAGEPSAEQDAASSVAEEQETVNLPAETFVSRRTLENFLKDETVLAAYQTSDEEILPLRSVFVIESSKSDFALVWDPQLCRMVGVVNMKAGSGGEDADEGSEGEGKEQEEKPSPYVMLAAGPSVFSGNRVDSEKAAERYFGFRMRGENPEFLYHFGHLAIEEQISHSEDGNEMRQTFRVRNQNGTVRLTFPKAFRDRMSYEGPGQWNENVLSLSKDESAEITLRYRLTDSD